MKPRLSRKTKRFISLLLMAIIILAIAPLVSATVINQSLPEPVNQGIIALTHGNILVQISFFDSLSSNVMNFLNSQIFQQLILGLLEAGVATLLLVISWNLINKFFRFLPTKVNELQAKYNTKTIRIGSKEVLRPEQITQFLMRVITFSRLVILGSIVLFYVNAVLSFFPQTQPIASIIFTSIFNAISQVVLGFVNYIPNLIFLIILFFTAYYSLKFIRFIFGEIEAGNLVIPDFDPEWAAPSQRIIQFLTIALCGVVAFPYLPGSNSGAFQGISIFIGVLLSIGSSTAVANIIAGILLTYTRAFRINDDILIGELWGTVIERGLFVTRLLNYENQFVSIPNSTILSSNVLNYRTNPQPNPRDNIYPAPLWIVEVAVPANVPSQQVYEILRNASRKVPNVVQEPEPIILSSAFKHNYMNYMLKYATHTPSIVKTGSAVRQQILDEFLSEGIILHPTQYIVYSSPNEPDSQKINPFDRQVISPKRKPNSQES
jgi:small-conductance mechanosensitive channel